MAFAPGVELMVPHVPLVSSCPTVALSEFALHIWLAKKLAIGFRDPDSGTNVPAVAPNWV